MRENIEQFTESSLIAQGAEVERKNRASEDDRRRMEEQLFTALELIIEELREIKAALHKDRP